MTRYCYGLLAWIAVLAAGCTELKLPSENEMAAVFITGEVGSELIEPEAPDTIPVLAPSELRDWHLICDECHIGPHYSSYTILKWGHLDSCVSDLAGVSCHDQRMHRTGLRGNKEICFDCHLTRQVSVECRNCHTSDCRAENIGHTSNFIASHGQQTEWQDMACDICHGGERWCRDCHGLPMPHPEDILATHPELVQGQAENCMHCHGSQSCTKCHTERGISPGQVVQ